MNGKNYLGNPYILVDKAHNEYLQIAVTLGIPALLTYLLLLFVVIQKSISSSKMCRRTRENYYCMG